MAVTKSTKSRNGTTDPAPRDSAPAPLKRFRIEKLEERIAPAKGGKGTNNCGTTYFFCGPSGHCHGY
jgi:hypothetical protein